MPRLVHRTPTYSRHRASGQAVITVNGKDHYLGEYGSTASKTEYDRITSLWLANGHALPGTQAAPDLTISELILKFVKHAAGYYRKPDGTPTSELKNYRDAPGPLRLLFGTTPAAEFGSLRLRPQPDARP
jgi:hypothetical protein